MRFVYFLIFIEKQENNIDATVLNEEEHSKLLTLPLCATNRINMPEVGDEIIRSGKADLVSMARTLNIK